MHVKYKKYKHFELIDFLNNFLILEFFLEFKS